MALLSAFNPHEFSAATVRTIATGREEDLKRILATIRGNLDAETIQHLIVSAPRGYGKSFMMRHIQIEVERIVAEDKLALAVVLMPEEMPHVKEPETLIRELTRALTGGAGADAELTWHEDDGAVWDSTIEALDAAIRAKLGERGLLVALVENFDALLRRAFPKEVQSSRLRAYLTQRGGRLMLIAASASGAFDRNYDDRLFHAFQEIALEPWSEPDCLAFFDRQRKDADKPPLDDAARARARAVSIFIGGTPRLATLLGDALFYEDVLRAADLLDELVEQLTPYYKERIEALPGRAQKLLDALLRGGEPATQSELARRVKANSQAAIAGPFSDLVKERVVVGVKAPDSAEMLYRVADRVFAHYYRRRIVDHGGAACPLESLVDLLAEYFSPEEKQAKAAEFARRGFLAEARLMARLHDADRGTSKAARQWMLYITARFYIPKRLLPLASDAAAVHLRVIADFVAEGAVDQAYARFEAAYSSATGMEDRVLLLVARSNLDAYEGVDGGLAAADEAVAAAEQIEDKSFETETKLVRAWSLFNLDRFTEGLNLSLELAEVSELRDRGPDQSRALRYVAFGLGELGRHEEAVATARQAADLADKASDLRGQAGALSLSAFSLLRRGRHEKAVAVARQAADLAEKAGDLRGGAEALRLAAFSLGELGRHEEAVATARQAADRANKAGDLWEQAVALRHAAFSLGELGRHEEAVAAARQAADLAKKAGDLRGQAKALRHASVSLVKLGRHEEAVATARQVADSAEKVGDLLGEATALFSTASSLSRLGRPEKAIATARQAADRAEKAGDLLIQGEALGMFAFNLGYLGDYAASIRALAASAAILDQRADDELNKLLIRSGDWIASRIAGSPSGTAVDLTELHELLGAAAETLDFVGLRRTCLGSLLRALAEYATRLILDPDRLDAWATAIELHFPGRFADETSRLRDTARYHASGRDPAALARLDPDLARTLETMFPPADHTPPKKKREGAKSSGRKR